MLKLKMSKLESWLNLTVLAGVLTILPLGFSAAASAASSSPNQSQITQAYSTDQSLQNGMIVGLNPARPSFVEALTRGNIKQMQGVVVPVGSAPLTISGSGNSDQVYVAALGRYPVLVSDQNGPINSGDYITISSIAGIGMKADDSQQLVVGKAAGSFSGGQNTLSRQTLSDGKTVDIGLATVDLGIAHNPLEATTARNPTVNFLLNLTGGFVGRDVGETRTFVALAMFVVTAIVVVITLYSGVRSGMVAAGRNPLARAAIGRNLFEVVLSAVVIFVIGLGAIYLELKL